MYDCVIEDNSTIVAGAVVTKGTSVPTGTIFTGMPAKNIKDVSTGPSSCEIDRNAENDVMYTGWFKAER